MVRLYYSPGACSLAVHIVLEWIGKPYEAIKVDYHDPKYLTINPAGAVPVLEYGTGKSLTQASAVLQYLATIYPEANLLDDRTPETSAEVQRWAAFLTGDLHPAFFPLFMPARYTISTDANALTDVQAAGIVLIEKKLTLLDAQLDGHDWIVGDKRTIIDAYAAPMLNWATAKLPHGLEPYQSLEAHHDRMIGDPAVRKVMSDEGLI
jgi:glutathione S-transferase